VFACSKVYIVRRIASADVQPSCSAMLALVTGSPFVSDVRILRKSPGLTAIALASLALTIEPIQPPSRMPTKRSLFASVFRTRRSFAYSG
jgi:hypothetical protein